MIPKPANYNRLYPPTITGTTAMFLLTVKHANTSLFVIGTDKPL